MDRSLGRFVVLVLLACMTVGGCAHTGIDEAGITSGDREAVDPVVVSRETTGTPLPYREYMLPPGGTVGGYAAHTACLVEPVSSESALNAVRVLDLETGENTRVVEHAVGAEQGLNILEVRCSDTWLVWEEMAGDCFEDPLAVRWALYALRLDGCEGVGDPIRISGMEASAQSRPLFSVVSDTVYWMTNSIANARQEGTIDQARVWSCVPGDGGPQLLYATGEDAFTFSAQEGELLLTQAVERGEDPARLVVLDPESGAVRRDIVLGNEGWLSHYAAYKDGACAWSEGDDDGVSAGDFLLRDSDGAVSLVARCANDAVFVGDYLFYEHKPYVRVGTTGRTQHWRVCALDPMTMEYRVVFDEEARVFGWVAPIGVAARDDGYLMYRSVPPWITEEEPGTWVRVYSVR